MRTYDVQFTLRGSGGTVDAPNSTNPMPAEDLQTVLRRIIEFCDNAALKCKAAHFAVMPVRVAQICILAGCPDGGTVLDPFFGNATTGFVAQKNGCNCIGIELNPEYVKLAKRRVRQLTLL